MALSLLPAFTLLFFDDRKSLGGEYDANAFEHAGDDRLLTLGFEKLMEAFSALPPRQSNVDGYWVAGHAYTAGLCKMLAAG